MLKIASIVPGKSAVKADMVFVKRQNQSLRNIGVNIVEYFLEERSSLIYLLSKYKIISKELIRLKPDLVHAHYGTVTSFFSSLFLRQKLVVTFRGSDLNPSRSVGFLRKFASFLMSQLSILKAELVICVSTELKQRLWWAKERAIVIPNGVNRDIFRPMDQKFARDFVGIDSTNLMLAFNAGKDPKIKRVDIFLKVAERIKKEIPDLEYYIFDGTTEPEKIPYFLNAADCLLVTSDSEGSPNIVKESIACHLPVVSFDVGDVKKLITYDDLSVVVDRGDEDLMVKHCLEILKMRRRTVVSPFFIILDEKVIASKLRDVYQLVLQK